MFYAVPQATENVGFEVHQHTQTSLAPLNPQYVTSNPFCYAKLQ